VTGQAAWYDLRVRVEKAAGRHDHSEPAFETMRSPPLPERPDVLRYGKRFRPSVKSQ
jgi:hypothetical protein